MKKEELLYRITGTETPLFVNERENCIIDKCLEIINEKSAVVENSHGQLTELTNPFKQFNLKEHTLYKVRVKVSEHNIEHEAFLFTGFKTGAYCVVYTNSYEHPEPLNKIHSMEILQELTNIKIAS